jgi:hypothetical protein
MPPFWISSFSIQAKLPLINMMDALLSADLVSFLDDILLWLEINIISQPIVDIFQRTGF